MGRRTLLALTAAALTAGTLGGASAAPGQITTLDTGCSTGNTCVWTVSNYMGDKKIIGNSPDQVWINLTGNFRNDISSVKNYFTDRKILFAHNDDGGGSQYCVNPNPGGAGISNIHWPNNDQFQSYRVGQSGSSC